MATASFCAESLADRCAPQNGGPYPFALAAKAGMDLPMRFSNANSEMASFKSRGRMMSTGSAQQFGGVNGAGISAASASPTTMLPHSHSTPLIPAGAAGVIPTYVRPKMELCKVWLLTGTCTKGKFCKKFHPPLEAIFGSVPASPLSPACLTERIAQARRSPIVMAYAELEPGMQKAYSILLRLTEDSLEETATDLFEMLVGNGDLELYPKVVKFIFTKAIHEPKQSQLLAKLLRLVIHRLPLTLRGQLTSLLGESIGSVDNNPVFAEHDVALKDKRLSNILFMGYLFLEGTLTELQLFLVMENMIRRSGNLSNLVEACFSVECACRLLYVVGKHLDSTSFEYVDDVLNRLLSATSKLSQDAYLIVANLICFRENARKAATAISEPSAPISVNPASKPAPPGPRRTPSLTLPPPVQKPTTAPIPSVTTPPQEASHPQASPPPPAVPLPLQASFSLPATEPNPAPTMLPRCLSCSVSGSFAGPASPTLSTPGQSVEEWSCSKLDELLDELYNFKTIEDEEEEKGEEGL